MKMIILLSLSGSIAMVFGIVLSKKADRLFSVRWQDLWIKMTAAFYLISGFVAAGVKNRMKKWHILEKPGEKIVVFLSHKAPGILKYETGFRVNSVFILYTVVTLMAALVMLFFFVKKLWEYRNVKRTITPGKVYQKADISDGEIERLRSMIHLKKKVRIYLTDLPVSAFTIGYFHPVIVLRDEPMQEKREVILLHEMCHIKRRDVLFKFIMTAAVCVHWFNPLVYYLPGMFNRSSELSCDEMVLRYLTPEQKKIYMQEIISQSRVVQKEGNLQAKLGGNRNLTAERIMRIMQKNGKNGGRLLKCLMSVLVIVMLIISSLPVCAYRGVTVFSFGEGEEEAAMRAAENISSSDHVFISSEEPVFEAVNMDIRFDRQFIDGEGNIYEADLNGSGRAGCTHPILVSGEYQSHDKSRDGGCVIKTYAVDRCEECGVLFLGELIAECTTYTECSHLF